MEQSVALWDDANDSIGAERAIRSALEIEGGDSNVDVLVTYGILQQEAFEDLVRADRKSSPELPHFFMLTGQASPLFYSFHLPYSSPPFLIYLQPGAALSLPTLVEPNPPWPFLAFLILALHSEGRATVSNLGVTQPLLPLPPIPKPSPPPAGEG